MKFKVLYQVNEECVADVIESSVLSGEALAKAMMPLYESAGVTFVGVVSVAEIDVDVW